MPICRLLYETGVSLIHGKIFFSNFNDLCVIRKRRDRFGTRPICIGSPNNFWRYVNESATALNEIFHFHITKALTADQMFTQTTHNTGSHQQSHTRPSHFEYFHRFYAQCIVSYVLLSICTNIVCASIAWANVSEPKQNDHANKFEKSG